MCKGLFFSNLQFVCDFRKSLAYRYGFGNSVDENSSLLRNWNKLVALSMGMQT